MSQSQDIEPGDLLLREVDEEVRRDQLKALWNKYGTYVIGAVAAVALAGAGVALYRDNEAKKAAAASERFSVAADLADKGKHEDAAQAFAALAGDKVYGGLARLRGAAERLELGDAEGAVKLFEGVAADGSVPGDLRDLASLRAIQVKLDTLEPEEARRRLTPLARPTSPFRFTAREFLAGVALRANDAPAARTELRALIDDPATPGGLRARARDLMETVEAEAGAGAPAAVAAPK